MIYKYVEKTVEWHFIITRYEIHSFDLYKFPDSLTEGRGNDSETKLKLCNWNMIPRNSRQAAPWGNNKDGPV